MKAIAVVLASILVVGILSPTPASATWMKRAIQSQKGPEASTSSKPEKAKPVPRKKKKATKPKVAKKKKTD